MNTEAVLVQTQPLATLEILDHFRMGSSVLSLVFPRRFSKDTDVTKILCSLVSKAEQ